MPRSRAGESGNGCGMCNTSPVTMLRQVAVPERYAPFHSNARRDSNTPCWSLIAKLLQLQAALLKEQTAERSRTIASR